MNEPILIAAVAGMMFGALLGYLLGRLTSAKQRRTQHSLALIDEFHDPKMADTRRRAWLALKETDPEELADQYGAVNLRTLFRHLSEQLGEERTTHVHIMFDFLNKCSFLMQARLVEPVLIRGAFGHLLRVWVDDYFAPFMQPDAEGGKWDQVLANLQRLRGML